METIKLGLSRKGYSVSSIDFIIGAERPSTRKQYQSTWKNFLNYLAAQNIDHSNISRPVVLDFLHFYSTEFHRKYRTIAGYKCALYCPLLWMCDLDLEDLLITTKFMRGAFNFNPPQKAKVMPKWSLNILLWYLRSSVFEPLERAPLYRLLQKTLTLLLLSSGRRKSDIANLSRVSSSKGGSLSLHWLPGFMPKRHSPSFCPPSPSISPLISNRESDKVQCPVRAYKLYVAKSQEWLSRLPSDNRSLDLWLVPGTASPASPDFLSKFFKKLVFDSRRAFNDFSRGGVLVL